MTQITLNITNPTSARAIRALAKTMDGVSIARNSKAVRQSRLDMAIEDAKKGRVTTWDSVEDLVSFIESI